MQTNRLLNRLDKYAKRKGLTINTAKSQVVHFYSHGFNFPAFSVWGAQLAKGLIQIPRHGVELDP